MISDEELIDELISRERLLCLSAYRTVGREMFERQDFYPAMWKRLSQDIAEVMYDGNVIGENVEQLQNSLKFSSRVVLLTTVEEENVL